MIHTPQVFVSIVGSTIRDVMAMIGSDPAMYRILDEKDLV